MTTDPLLNAALDRFAVPPPSAHLAARIIAAAEALEPATALPGAAPRRDRRGAWVRARNVVLGTAALGLMSATAAASGLFGGQRIHIPVISTIVAAAIPEPKKAPPPKAAPKLARQETPRAEKLPEATGPEIIVPAPPPPEAILGTPEARRAERAAKIAERMEARLTRIEAEGAAKGKPAPTQRRRALLEQLKAAKTDEERRTAFRAIEADNARLREQRAAKLGIDPATLKQKRDPLAQRTPEERRAMLERRAARLGIDPAELEAQLANQPKLSPQERRERFEKRRARMEELRKAQGAAPAETPATEEAAPPSSEAID